VSFHILSWLQICQDQNRHISWHAKDWQESQGKAGQHWSLQTKTLKNKCGKFWLCTTPGPVCSQAKPIISLSRKTWIFKQKFLGIPNLQVAPLARRFKHCLSILKVRCVQPKRVLQRGGSICQAWSSMLVAQAFPTKFWRTGFLLHDLASLP
jgi:hypothetical protein